MSTFTSSYKTDKKLLYPCSVNTHLLYLNKDNLLKNNNLTFLNILKYDKIIIGIHVQKIEKIYDYFILQSICLIDTITAQKPKLKVLKCKFTFGSKAFSYSCKATLRRRKIQNFISLFKYVVMSEMKRRHINVTPTLNNTLNKFSFCFSLNNTNVFFKLDEFYFKWNYPIVFTFVPTQSLVKLSINKNEYSYSYKDPLFINDNEQQDAHNINMNINLVEEDEVTLKRNKAKDRQDVDNSVGKMFNLNNLLPFSC